MKDVLYPLGFSTEAHRGAPVEGFSILRDDSTGVVAMRRDDSDPATPRRDVVSVFTQPARDGGAVATRATAASTAGDAHAEAPLSPQATRALNLLAERCGTTRGTR